MLRMFAYESAYESAYLSPMGWPCIYSRCFTSWMVIRILAYWMGYFLDIGCDAPNPGGQLTTRQPAEYS